MFNSNYLKNNNGMALALTLMVLVVSMILFSVVMTITMSNTRQIKHQEESVRAHYVALSGINMATGALMTTKDEKTLIEAHFMEATPTELSETIVLSDGSAVVTMRAINDVKGDRWVEVESVGTLVDGLETSRTLILRVNAEIPAIQQWIKD